MKQTRLIILILAMFLPMMTSAVVKRTIHVATAGSLPELISDVDKHKIEKLTLTGELNGTDIKFIREMAGDSVFFMPSYYSPHAATNGKLKSLDISNVNIVAGGSYYYVEKIFSMDPEVEYYGTEQNSISRRMFCFASSSGLEEIILPSSVTSIDVKAFGGDPNILESTKLESLKVGEGNRVYDSRNSCNAIIETGTNTLIVGCKATVIPNSVTFIGSEAFRECYGLTSITIPNSVTSIGSYAFDQCSGLTSVTIPNSVTTIGGYAFSGTPWYENQPDGVVYAGKVLYKYKGTMPEGTKISIKKGTLGIAGSAFSSCKSLISVTIPNGVTTIGDYAFNSCSGLTSVTIPNSVTSIGYDAFDQCSGLTSVTIGNSVTSIGSSAFYGCSGLTSVSIPNSVTTIGSHAFSSCSGLTSVTIPNSVIEIGGCAFYCCSGLSSVTIGSEIKNIEWYAFEGCPKLTDVYCYAANIPKTDKNTFAGSNIYNATLHVPADCVDAYKAVEPWSGFKEIVKISGKVKLDQSKAILEKGNTMTLKATVTPSTLLDKSVTWKSSNTAVATVTSKGKVKGVKAGTATITCTSNVTGAKATCKVTVGYVKLDQTEAILGKTKTMTLTATVYPSKLEDKSVTWQSTDTKVATVTSGGKVKGVKAGTAIIICTSVATSLSAICEVTVGSVSLNKSKAFLEKGKTVTLKATVQSTVSDDKSVIWESSDKSIATVSSTGKVKGVKYGTATITCTSVATGLSATCKVTVGKVVINIPEFTLRRTRTATLKATVYPTTLTDKSVTWESSDTKVATVTSSGKVKGIKAGTATITCTSVATGLKGTCTVTVLSTSESRSLGGDDDETTGIEENAVALEPFDVYDLSGRKVLHQVTSLDGLANGIYIVNGKKVLKKQ